MQSNNKSNSLVPLSEQAFFILLSLAPGKKHGYAILKDVEDFSASALVLSTSTVYGALGRMQEQGLIVRVSVEGGEKPRPGLPRKFYELSKKGRRVLLEETQRMQALVLLAEQRLGEVVG
ncbi:MAG: PadR family transcriptional regulator [Anaerolineales bacterium]|nr:PadR family transcriptional regulator [Anaerolineales bacterium]